MSAAAFFGKVVQHLAERQIDKHRVFIKIQNNTNFTLQCTAKKVDHGKWSDKYGAGFAHEPPDKLEPGQSVHLVGVIYNSAGHNIEVCIRYKKVGDHRDLFVIHIWCPLSGENNYYDTGLEQWAKRDYLLQEYGDWRDKKTGADSVKVDAGFALRLHPFGHQGGDDAMSNGAHTSAAPSGVVFDNKIHLFFAGREGCKLWYTKYQDVGGGNYKWTQTHTEACMGLVGAPSAVVYKDKIYVFHRGLTTEAMLAGKMGQDLRYNVLDPRKGDWGQWGTDKQAPGVFIRESPSAVVYDNKIWIAHKGANGDGSIWILTFDEDHGFTKLGQIAGATGPDSPGLVVYHDNLLCFWHDGGHLFSAEFTKATGKFGEKRQVPGTGTSYSPTAVATAKNLYVIHKAWGSGTGLWCNMWDGQSWSGDIGCPDTHISNSPSALIFGTAIWIFHQGPKDEIRAKLIDHS